MRTKVLLVMVLLMSLSALAYPVWATDTRSGNSVSVPQDATIDDDLVAAGSSVDIRGTVTGDLVGFGSTIMAAGPVGRDALLAGGTVNVTGRIGNTIRAAGGTVTVGAPVSQNADIAGGNVTLDKSASVGKDLQVAGGTVSIDGRVGRNLRIGGGQVTINGTVGGNVNARVDQLKLGPNAVVHGNLVYRSSRRAQLAPGARVLGTTSYSPEPARQRQGVHGPSWFLAILSLFMLFLVGALIYALTPRSSESVANRAISSPWVSLLTGFVLLVAVPVLLAILMVTIIGLPLALILLALYLIVLYISRIYVALAVGRLLVRSTVERPASPYLVLFVGLLVLVVVSTLLSYVPVLGGLFNFLVLILGLGALAYERYHLTRSLRSEGRI